MSLKFPFFHAKHFSVVELEKLVLKINGADCLTKIFVGLDKSFQELSFGRMTWANRNSWHPMVSEGPFGLLDDSTAIVLFARVEVLVMLKSLAYTGAGPDNGACLVLYIEKNSSYWYSMEENALCSRSKQHDIDRDVQIGGLSFASSLFNGKPLSVLWILLTTSIFHPGTKIHQYSLYVFDVSHRWVVLILDCEFSTARFGFRRIVNRRSRFDSTPTKRSSSVTIESF